MFPLSSNFLSLLASFTAETLFSNIPRMAYFNVTLKRDVNKCQKLPGKSLPIRSRKHDLFVIENDRDMNIKTDSINEIHLTRSFQLSKWINLFMRSLTRELQALLRCLSRALFARCGFDFVQGSRDKNKKNTF